MRPTYAVREAELGEETPAWLMLIEILSGGAELDEDVKRDSRGWQATPQARFERLLRETNIPIGLLANGSHIRLVYAPRPLER